ncbi:MAG: hypothetical protein LBG68_02360 [Coriobacteriales bacterium]|jgi:hypothetical protein|nr:hypothetical protein [Coriobacteriales bacterium]
MAVGVVNEQTQSEKHNNIGEAHASQDALPVEQNQTTSGSLPVEQPPSHNSLPACEEPRSKLVYGESRSKLVSGELCNKLVSDKTAPRSVSLTRREILKLLATGVLSITALNLTGCIRSRSMLALDLLRDKYDRAFKIVEKAYNFNTSSKPKAFCCATNEPDLVFDLEISVSEEKILDDTYVGRKLGRQAEEIINECLDEQGIKSASHGVVDTYYLGVNREHEYNPDVSFEDFIDRYHEVRISATIVITEEVESPRTSPAFSEAMIKAFHLLGDTQSSISIYVVKETDFKEYHDHFLSTAWFYSSRMVLEGQPIDLFRVKVRDSEVEIGERIYQ